jgi:AcrR family transcriptional regulator
MRAKSDAPLSAERWRAAALEALADGGVATVAIEPLAKRLGVTKGGGYWHFENREALLSAALDEWKTRTAEVVIARLRRIVDPRERLIALFKQALTKRDPIRRALCSSIRCWTDVAGISP